MAQGSQLVRVTFVGTRLIQVESESGARLVLYPVPRIDEKPITVGDAIDLTTVWEELGPHDLERKPLFTRQAIGISEANVNDPAVVIRASSINSLVVNNDTLVWTDQGQFVTAAKLNRRHRIWYSEEWHQVRSVTPKKKSSDPKERARRSARRPITNAVIARKLGLPVGPLMLALVKLCEEESAAEPENALEVLWVRLWWLHPDVRRPLSHGTPSRVISFVETGGDLNHFGFLEGSSAETTDERAIVLVEPKGDAPRIVAENLATFLGLIALASAEAFIDFGGGRASPSRDRRWRGWRTEWYASEPKRLAEMNRLSDKLLALPGVVAVKSPSRAILSHRWRDHQFSNDDEP